MNTRMDNNPEWLMGYSWATDRVAKGTYKLEDMRVLALTDTNAGAFNLGVLKALADFEEVERLNAEKAHE